MSKVRKSSVEIQDSLITITFQPESSDSIASPYDFDSLSEEMQRELGIHGLKQKLTDSFAGSTGVEECKANADRVWQALEGGSFTSRSGSSAGPRIGLLAEALAAVTSQPIADVQAKLDAIKAAPNGAEVLKKLRSDSRIRKATLEIQVARESGKATEGGFDLAAF